MIEEGTKIMIEGVPYRVVSAVSGTKGIHFLVITHDNPVGTDIRNSIKKLMSKIPKYQDRFVCAELIVKWFIDEKLKSGINMSQILAIKNNPSYAKIQIRRLIKGGESIECIIETLAFAITDSFWSGILNTSINTIAIPKDDGLTLYQKIKSKMISSRHAEIKSFHEQTEDEAEGIIVTE
jgi:hypothetical protein